jgi:hypothetical protein
VTDPQQRNEAIAKSYAGRPENTLIVWPDNASRQAINQAVRVELQERGAVSKNESTFLILTPRSEMTGADRAWAQVSAARCSPLQPRQQRTRYRARQLRDGACSQPEGQFTHGEARGR